ncbi:DUF1028 domain-containing protein [Rubrobacter calidifluminis]|uniref:DUF1028 domain-containing protein n=1 Tax=Rubrobacter calidifluminis TaxID=1392640 RepID=UPI00235E0119|nr:DUF1028 domain-containing protein [Rubrobacter calidifluminis]
MDSFPERLPLVATFSIVGCDAESGELGVAVQSKFLAVGAVVPWARAGVGAVATQAMANTTYGPRGLEMMSEGKSARETIAELVASDPESAHRQVGVVDATGQSATFTGDECMEWAGGVAGEEFAAQGNILVGGETVEAMARTFQASEGPLAGKLLSALRAGQEAGGDRRGRQSAALLVVCEGGGYGGFDDRAVDLRVDDHPEPIEELVRLYGLHRLYFGRSSPEDVIAIEGEVRDEVVRCLARLGYLRGAEVSDDDLHPALEAFVRTENFEEREQERGYIDRAVLGFLRERAGGGA